MTRRSALPSPLCTGVIYLDLDGSLVLPPVLCEMYALDRDRLCRTHRMVVQQGVALAYEPTTGEPRQLDKH